MNLWYGLLCGIWMLACTAAHAAEPVLHLATGELPPYATQDRSDEGLVLNIVRMAFAKAGYRVEYTFLPWTRALQETKAGKWDGTAYWGYTAQRKHDFLLSDTVIVEPWVLLYRADMHFDWHQLSDLKPYVVATVQDYTYTPELWALINSHQIKNDTAMHDLSSLRKLVAGRVDIVPLDRNVACYMMQKYLTPAEATRIRAHPRLLSPNFTTHVMLNRSDPKNPERLAAFNLALKQLRQSGSIPQEVENNACFGPLPAQQQN